MRTLEIQRTAEVLDETLRNLPDGKLTQPFPLDLGGTRVSTLDFLIHLTTHLAFHVGQIDYHHRPVTGGPESVGPIAIPESASVQAAD